MSGLAGKTFPHGVHPPEHKEATEAKAVTPFPMPAEVVVPLSQHIGAPAVATVKKKQEVQRGELIAEAGGFVSVPMHAPAAGTVAKIDSVRAPNGRMVPAVTIKVDVDADHSAVVTSEPKDWRRLSAQELVSAVQDTGIVGLGGAAFPTHVKLAVPPEKTVDTVIANGCECEPYLTCDHRVMLEQKEALFEGLRIAIKATNASRAIIGIENNKPDVIKELRAALPQDAPITVEAVKTKYPQGAEKMLIKALLKREVPSGGLPADVGAACFNVATLSQFAQLMAKGQGMIERVITVTGSCVKKPGNYMIPMGTNLRDILEHVGVEESVKTIVMGGPMMGMAVGTLDMVVTKGVSGILLLSEAEMEEREQPVYACIRCGACVNACPLYLNPSRLGILARKGEYDAMARAYHLNDCFECGSCTYVCPSNIPLVHYFRMAKQYNRERKNAK